MSSEELQQRISVEYAPLVALYQLLEDRSREPGSAAVSGPDWNARLAALRVLREGAVPGDGAALAEALLDPAHRDVRQVAVVTSPDRLAGLLEEAVRLGERVLLFGDAARVPDGLLAVDAALRPVGPRWEEELRVLRRDLLKLEQWPGDLAALEEAEAEAARRETAAAEEEQRLEAALESLRAEREQAAEATAQAVGEREAAVAAEQEAGVVAARCLEVFTEAKDAAVAAARRAATASSAAGEVARRRSELEQRLAALRVEAASARQVQGDLGERLERARASLPEVAAAAERTREQAAEAEALRHATYYRLAGAESSLAAERKRQCLAQRLHLAPGRPQLSELRAVVASRKLDAEQAMARANELNEARQRAEGERAGLTAFLEQGGREMEAAREVQRRLTVELPRLEAELVPVRAEHERLAARAAEAAEEAARTAEPADRARTEGMAAEERLAAARAALAEAEAAIARAREHETELDRALAEKSAERERHETAGAETVAEARRERDAARETADRHRNEIDAFLNGLNEETWREQASARHELLTTAPGEAAQVICATPDDIPPGEYDVLFVDAAETVTDGDFLLGAVRTRRQVLVGTPGASAPAPATALRDLLNALHSLAGLPLPTAPDEPTAPEETNRPETPTEPDEPTVLDSPAVSGGSTVLDGPTELDGPTVPGEPTVLDSPAVSGGSTVLDGPTELDSPAVSGGSTALDGPTELDSPAVSGGSTALDGPTELDGPTVSGGPTELEGTVESGGTSESGGVGGLSEGAVAERERLRAGLWEGHYAERHAKIVRRLSGLGLDPVEALERAVAERLETGFYQRCLDAVA
ncbi:hypothetical protein [Actinocorallia libanotica]|uniref:Uncharacterized protein n=1 Tax=Actinocorallia libanotica TaxID=46162 RepID=A0ABN1RFX3_9ACTN